MSLIFYILRVRFGSRVRLKPRGKQVPVAPQSLKANVDKPQLKYKAVFDTKMSHGSRCLTETGPKGLKKGHNGNNPNLSARNGYQQGEKPCPITWFCSVSQIIIRIFIS